MITKLINFFLKHPEVVNPKNGVNPRSMVTFFNAISSIADFGSVAGLSLIQMIGEGCVGPEVTSLFTTFINNKLDKLLTPEEIMNMKDKDLVKEMDVVVGKTNLKNYRADIASILCTRVVNYMTTFASQEKNKVTDDHLDRIEKLCVEEHFGPDLSYHMVKTLFAANVKFKKLAARNKLTKHVIA